MGQKAGAALKHYLIAHDLGTSGDKATLFDTEGNLIRSVTTAYDTHFFNANWAEQNPRDWWEAFCVSTKHLVSEIDAKEVAAVSFSGQMMGCTPVDAAGRALRTRGCIRRGHTACHHLGGSARNEAGGAAPQQNPGTRIL